jgi:hypothetical protein
LTVKLPAVTAVGVASEATVRPETSSVAESPDPMSLVPVLREVVASCRMSKV